MIKIDKLIKILESIDEAISKSWGTSVSEECERRELFNMRGIICDMIQKKQREKGGRK